MIVVKGSKDEKYWAREGKMVEYESSKKRKEGV